MWCKSTWPHQSEIDLAPYDAPNPFLEASVAIEGEELGVWINFSDTESDTHQVNSAHTSIDSRQGLKKMQWRFMNCRQTGSNATS